MGDGRLSLRERAAAVRAARLATVDADGSPHVAVIVFAIDGDRIFTPIDHKPKRSLRLKRLDNIASNPRVAVLFDHYEDDWSRLWWVRADGVAAVIEPGTPGHRPAAEALTRRYDQYRDRPLGGPIIEITVGRWSGWAAAD